MKGIHRGAFKYLAAALCLLVCLVLFPGRADPDFGNFSGNSDYGGDPGGSFGGGGGYSGGGGGYSRSGGGGLNFTPLYAASALSSSEGDDWILIAIVVIVLLFVASNMRRNMQRARQSAPSSTPIPVNTASPADRGLKPMDGYASLDPFFDAERLKTHISNLYVQMQDAWHRKDIEELHPTMTDAFYNQMERQLEGLRKARQTDYTERIAVLGVELLGYRQGGGMDCVTAQLTTRIVTYILDDRTGNLVSGDKNRERFMVYEWDLVRKTGTATSEPGAVRTENCPHCGAPLTVGASARCAYCGSVVEVLDADWAVSAIRGVSQRTA